MGKRRGVEGEARHFAAGRVKKIMQSSEDVGRVGHGAQEVVARACELLVGELARGAVGVSEYTTQSMLGPGHLKLCVEREPTFDFLKEPLSGVPDLEVLPEPVKRAPPRKSAPKKSKPPPKQEAQTAPASGQEKGGGGGAEAPAGDRPGPTTGELQDAAARLTIPRVEPAGGAGRGKGEGDAGTAPPRTGGPEGRTPASEGEEGGGGRGEEGKVGPPAGVVVAATAEVSDDDDYD